MKRSAALTSLAVCVLLAGAGCSRSPHPNFYTLEAATRAEPAAAPASGFPAAIAVGPVTLPESADRPQLVVRVAPNRVEILEMQRWAEPLKSALPRVISRDLAQLLGARVSSYLERTAAGAECHVVLDIERFDAVPGEAVSIDAAWSVRRGPAGESAVRTGRTQVREQVRGEGYDPVVAAYSRALLTVSTNLAATIRAEYAAPAAPAPAMAPSTPAAPAAPAVPPATGRETPAPQRP